MSVDAQLGKQDLELIVCTTVNAGTRNNVVTSLTKGSNGKELSSLAYLVLESSIPGASVMMPYKTYQKRQQ